MKVKFVTKGKEPDVKEVTVVLEDVEDGVSLRAGGYYIATLTNDGNLKLHGGVNHDGVVVDDDGYIELTHDKLRPGFSGLYRKYWAAHSPE